MMQNEARKLMCGFCQNSPIQPKSNCLKIKAISEYLLWRYVATLLWTVIFFGLTMAQTQSEGATQVMTAPGAPAGSYALSGFENVNLFNGNLNFNLPLAKVGGRGKAQSSVNLAIDSVRWNLERPSFNRNRIITNNPSYSIFDSLYITTTRCQRSGSYNQSCGGPDCLGSCPIGASTCEVTTFNCTSATETWGNFLAVDGGMLNPADGTFAPAFWYVYEDLVSQRPGYGPGILIRRSGKFGRTNDSSDAPVPYFTLTRLYFIAPDGTEYELRDALTDGNPIKHYYNQPVNRGTVFVSPDGSGMKFVSDTQISEVWGTEGLFNPVSGMLYFPDGTKYRIDNNLVSWIKDVDGNQINYAYTGGQVSTITDSLGRQTQITYANPTGDPNITFNAISTQKSATEWQTVKVYQTKMGQVLRGDFQLLTKPQMFPELNLEPDTELYNPTVVSKVELPDGRNYKLFYTSYNEIARVELPTGAAIEYEFPTTGYQYSRIFRPVLERRMYENGGSTVQNSPYNNKQKYMRNVIPTGTYPNYGSKITMEEHSGTMNGEASELYAKSDHYFYGFAGSVSHKFYAIWNEGREFKTESFDKNGVLRGRTETEWEKPATVAWGDIQVGKNTRVKSVTSTMFEGGQSLTNKTEYGYDNTSLTNNKTDEWVRDYGTNGVAGRILKHSQTSYLNINPANGLDYTSDSIYLHGLPTSSKLFDVKVDGAEELISNSETKYDEPVYPLMTYGGSPTGWTNPNTTARGKPTTTKTWFAEENRWLETHAQFDQFGNARKVWDVSGDASRFVESEYSAAYQYGFPTKVTTPAPDPTNTNGTNETSFATTGYNFYTGQTLSITDEFGQTTATEYNDILLRPTRTFAVNFTAPETQIEYGDAVGNLNVKVKKQIDQQNWDEATTYADGLGRTFKTQAKDSQGDVFVETEYDNLGRVKRTTNPYRLGEQKLWSKPRYDELGRAVESFAPAPDGQTGASLGITSYAISTVANYIGTVVTSTDASLRKSRSITNALGQLVRVDEPTATGGTADADLGTLSNPTQPTFYKYSPQGKMVEVTQGGQKRFFLYDSLGRLIRVRQPEQQVNTGLNLTDAITGNNQWTAGFSYDILGNVLTATDAKGVTITNSYDNANRVKTRSYAGEAAGQTTPSVSYFYDGKGLSSQQSPNYAKGTLTKVASSVSETRYTLFDNLGRLTQMEQRTPFADELAANATPRVSSYLYNLSGALIQETYPSGRVVKNEFETDGDLSRISGNALNQTEKTYANGFSYTADGKIQRLRLGNGRWESAKFNSRLQVTELALGASNGDGGLWKLAYEYGELNTDGITVNTTKNTGNIAKQTVSFNGLAQPFVQTYKYDSLYRLTEARETNNNQQTWKQTFGYDRFGNRTNFSQIIGTQQLVLNNQNHPAIDATTNRFTTGQGYIFDFNGNLITDAQGRQFTFNGENKQTEVRDVNNQPIGTYFYDGEGKRVKKVTNLETTIFVYSSGKLVAEYSTAAPLTNPTTSYTATDQLGSPRVITNAFGQVTSRRDFLPFGEELYPDTVYRKTSDKYGATDSVRQRFTGYEKDTETGLDFAEARYYNNQHARFTAVDPLLASGKSANPQTFNRYVYVLNNPLILTDPTGLQAGNHKGDVYFKVASNGRYEFSKSSQRGRFGLYEGRTRNIVGIDGYRYTVFRGGWTQGRKVADAQRTGGTRSASATKAFVNQPLINSLAEETQKKGRIARNAGLLAGAIGLGGGPLIYAGVPAANAIGGTTLAVGGTGGLIVAGANSSGSSSTSSETTPTPTPNGGGYNLVLGLNQDVGEFVNGTNQTYVQRVGFPAGLVWNQSTFLEQASNADRIIFTLKSFDYDRYETWMNRTQCNCSNPAPGDITNAELHTVLNTPELFNKTDFKYADHKRLHQYR